MEFNAAITFAIWLLNHTWPMMLLIIGLTIGGAIIGLIINQADQIDLDIN